MEYHFTKKQNLVSIDSCLQNSLKQVVAEIDKDMEADDIKVVFQYLNALQYRVDNAMHEIRFKLLRFYEEEKKNAKTTSD